jgi:PAS domain-containing protein
MENPTWHNIETCLLTKHRQAIPVLISGSAFHDKDNRRLGTVVVARDIRHRIRARKALKASEEKYRTLYETSRDGIAFSDMKGNLMDGNRAFLDMTGYTLPELMKMNYSVFHMT